MGQRPIMLTIHQAHRILVSMFAADQEFGESAEDSEIQDYIRAHWSDDEWAAFRGD